MVKTKVEITLNTGETLWGFIFVEEQRVQDVLNDSRLFIPVHLLRDRKGREFSGQYKMSLFNKNSIMKVEELV